MQSSLSKKTIKDLSKNYNIPEYKVRDVINSFFHLAAFTIKNETNIEKDYYPTIGIPYFGKFYHYRKKKKDEDI